MKHWSEETNWQHLAVFRDLFMDRVNAAIAARDEFTAEQAHTDLICVEWRLRQAERRRDRG